MLYLLSVIRKKLVQFQLKYIVTMQVQAFRLKLKASLSLDVVEALA